MSTMVKQEKWKAGELAARTGLTVRTLHHYEAIGLLVPSERTPSGHRLYGREDVLRLQKIISLRQLGLTLEDVGRALDGGVGLDGLLERQIAHIRRRIELERELCERLQSVREWLERKQDVSLDALMEAMELTMEIERHYTPEQLEYLKRRREELGDARIREVQEAWPKLIAAVRAEMGRGTDPASDRMRELATQWAGLVREFTGGNQGVTTSLRRMVNENVDRPGGHFGIDRAMFEYVGRAMQAAGITI